MYVFVLVWFFCVTTIILVSQVGKLGQPLVLHARYLIYHQGSLLLSLKSTSWSSPHLEFQCLTLRILLGTSEVLCPSWPLSFLCPPEDFCP